MIYLLKRGLITALEYVICDLWLWVRLLSSVGGRAYFLCMKFAPIKSFVFGDFDFDQQSKVVAGVNSEFSEVWWFYPSKSSATNDRYVIYNYQEKVWYFGNLTRTA